MSKLTARQKQVLRMQMASSPEEPSEFSVMALFYEGIVSREEASYAIILFPGNTSQALYKYQEAVFDLCCLLLLDAGETL